MTLYESIGGEPAVRAAVAEFYRRVVADPELAGYFAGVDLARLKAHQRAFLATAVGGPGAYHGRSMTDAHAGLGITGAAFDAVVAHLAAALTTLGVPEPEIARIAATLAPLRADIVEDRMSNG
ncbi:group I truncated hemoglobin [Catenuloplanes atrovinosus]|uniref:Group 1 truncated hemoglobin n=1 Tax=Catenuloplanes atrovinosus TaxID=137266 RepID=A0AAE4CAG2_9ACTN|nr:group 1 truncated hemoglobin [Catenuloplanes atrovinosus]MDR7277571.1 hemoglobin [Catenuloplanes atrovinosus]